MTTKSGGYRQQRPLLYTIVRRWYCTMAAVGVSMQGGVRQGCHMILPVVLGAHAARRRLATPEWSLFFCRYLGRVLIGNTQTAGVERALSIVILSTRILYYSLVWSETGRRPLPDFFFFFFCGLLANHTWSKEWACYGLTLFQKNCAPPAIFWAVKYHPNALLSFKKKKSALGGL